VRPVLLPSLVFGHLHLLTERRRRLRIVEPLDRQRRGEALRPPEHGTPGAEQAADPSRDAPSFTPPAARLLGGRELAHATVARIALLAQTTQLDLAEALELRGDRGAQALRRLFWRGVGAVTALGHHAIDDTERGLLSRREPHGDRRLLRRVRG